ncbi:MAG TPA: response regulator [Verrucomicrobiae bacterium]|nr:response regulator [Verrucomicrobiae bacterium]
MEPRRQTILIVDDEAPMRELLQETLSGEGYELLTATDGKDALKQVLGLRPDLILLDIRMPKLDGVTLCKALRVYKETQSIPIIMLTALSSRDRLEECMAAGADDFVGKPFDVVELRMRVRAMLKLKQVNDEVDRLQKYILTLREMRDEGSAPQSNT